MDTLIAQVHVSAWMSGWGVLMRRNGPAEVMRMSKDLRFMMVLLGGNRENNSPGVFYAVLLP
jgi:hypothetical protein